MVDVPYPALDISEGGVQEHVYYAIIGPGGIRLTGYDDLNPPLWKIDNDQPTMVDMNFRQQSIRMGILVKRLYDPELVGGDAVTILFAETTQSRTRLAFSMFMESLRPQFLLMGIGLFLIAIVLRKC